MVLVLVPEAVIFGDVPTGQVPTIEGELVGYDDAGSEVARIHVGEIPEPAGPTPEIDRVWTILREARDLIMRYSGPDDDTLNTFNVETARRALPTVRWNDLATVVPNEVSIRGLKPTPGTERGNLVAWKLAIVSVTPSGDTYCIAISVDQHRSSTWRYGTQDAQSFSECRGGW